MLPGLYSRRKLGAAGGGGGAPLVSIDTVDYSSIVMDPSDAACGFTFSGTGQCTGLGGATYTWKLTAAPSTDYEIRIDNSAGSTSGSAKGVWHPAAGVTCSLTRTLFGESYATVLVQIRAASGGAVLASAYVSFTAIVDA